MGKAINRASCGIGFFAQARKKWMKLVAHERRFSTCQRTPPGVMQSKLRAQFAGFGLGRIEADTEVGRLSGGQKARLSLLLATLDAPHLLNPR